MTEVEIIQNVTEVEVISGGMQGPPGPIAFAIPFSRPGEQGVLDAGTPWYVEQDVTVRGIRASVKTAPAGAPIIVQVWLDSVTLVGEVEIPAGAVTSGFTPPDEAELESGGYLTVSVTSVGTTEPGADLVVAVWMEAV